MSAAVRAEVVAALGDAGVVDDGDLPLAVSEVVANAREHGHPPVEVDVRVRAGEVTVLVRDAGPGPRSAPPARAEPTAERGRGRALAHQLAVVEEQRTERGFEVRLRPLRPPPTGTGTPPG